MDVAKKPLFTPKSSPSPRVEHPAAPTATEPTTPEPAQQSAGATKQMRAVLGDVEKRSPRGGNAGSVSGKTGLALFGKKVEDALKIAVKSAIVGAFLLVGSAAWAPTIADTVFLDHNDAPMEISVAKRLAASINEKFVLVRPDKASLEAVFAQAERGEIDIRHLILSGHSTGQSVWGKGADGERRQTSMDELKKLKLEYPKAFDQVEHVHFMACYAGSAGNSAEWSAVFPNAKAIVGFWGSGPAKTQPAAQKMLENSERHLRTLDGKTLSPQAALIEAKRMANMPGSNVTKFAVRLDGVHYALGEKVEPHAVLQDRVRMLGATAFTPWMNPVAQAAEFASTPTNHQASPLRDYYNALQSYRGAVEAGSSEASSLTAKIDTTIRLIYFDVIVAKMHGQHGAEIEQARTDLAAVGFTLPDLTKATRLQVVEIANALDAMKAPQLRGFGERFAAELALVKSALGEELSKIDETSYPYAIGRVKEQLATLVSSVEATVTTEVHAAADRLLTELAKEAPASIERAQELIGKGLRDLKSDLVPSSWID